MKVKLFLVKQELQKAFIYVTNRDSVFFVTSYYDKKDFQNKAELIEKLNDCFGVNINLFVFNILRKEIIFCGDEEAVNKLNSQLCGEVISTKGESLFGKNLFFWYSYEEWPPSSIDFYYDIITKK